MRGWGTRPITDLKPVELLAALRRVETKGVNETAHRALQVCGRVMRYAVATGRADRDFTRDLAGALAPVKERHLASITEPSQVAALLRAIDSYNGSFVTKCALRLAPLVFVRPKATVSLFNPVASAHADATVATVAIRELRVCTEHETRIGAGPAGPMKRRHQAKASQYRRAIAL